MNISHRSTRIGLSAAAVLVALSSTSLAQLTPIEPRRYYTWEKLGPMPRAGLEIWSLADTPADPKRVYAGTSGGVSASYDGGQTWELRSPVEDQRGYYSTVDVSPDDADVLLLTTFDKGMWRSVDGGLSWSRPVAPPASTYLSNPTFAPSSGNVAYVVTWDGVARSLDGGQTFTQVLSAAGFVYDLVVDHADRTHLYVMVWGSGIHESHDAGSTWVVKNFPASGTSSTFAIDPADGDRLMVGHGGTVYVSADGADNWYAAGTGLPGDYIDVVAFDPDNAKRLYAGVRTVGFASSDDGGATWTVSADPALDTAGGNPVAILASRFHPDMVVLGDSGGAFHSMDDGQTFQRRNNGLETHAAIRAVVVDPFFPNHLVATTGGSAFWSDDSGLSWTESIGVRRFWTLNLAADPVNPNRYYAASWTGEFWRSDDGGRTFYRSFAHSGANYFFKAVAHPTVNGRIFASGNRLWRSDDGGLSFVNTGAPVNWCWALTISPVDPDVMYCAGSNAVYRSLDGGASWDAAVTSPASIVRGMIADPVNPHRAYAAAPYSGLYRTDDAGKTWTRLANRLGNSDTCIIPVLDPGHLIVNSFDDVETFSSLDAGATAARLGPGQEAPIISFAQTPGRVFAGTTGAGVMVLKRH